MRAIFGDDWQDIPTKKTAWGTAVDSGWWQIRLKALEGKVAVTLKGKLSRVRTPLRIRYPLF
jgi:translation initiation factor 2-alpha kinase 4